RGHAVTKQNGVTMRVKVCRQLRPSETRRRRRQIVTEETPENSEQDFECDTALCREHLPSKAFSGVHLLLLRVNFRLSKEPCTHKLYHCRIENLPVEGARLLPVHS